MIRPAPNSTLRFPPTVTIVRQRLSGETVMRRSLIAAVLCTLPCAPLGAQQTGTTITLTVSPSFVNFDDFGGSFGAAVARLSISRDFSRMTGGELSVFALAPLGGASSQPGCVIGSPCQSRSTPSLLSGALTSVFGYAGESGLRAALGVGGVVASGGEGLRRRSSLAGLVGLDWIPRTNNRFAPTFAVRLVQLSTPIAGARQLLLPGVGLTF